jgi:hypothetical protein
MVTISNGFYFQTTNNDFSENSPGMMLIEMSAYVGDILSLYLENQIQETFTQFTKQRKNLLSQAYVYGYFPKVTNVSQTILDIYQLLPALNISGSFIPDFNYSLIIDENAQIQTNNNIKFLIEDKIDFSVSSSSDNTEISIYSTNNNFEPEYYLIKKQRKAYSANIKQININIPEDFERFKTIEINDDKIIKILNVTDSDNNKWYEVPYLAQDIVYTDILNNNNNPLYKLLPIQTSKRFITRFKSNNKLEIQFGSGNSDIIDEEIIPNSDNVGIGLPYNINKLYTAYDPSNFLYTNSYGSSPKNTTLTITYLLGGGIESNVNSNEINILSNANIYFKNNVNSNEIFNSITFNNEFASVGGGDGDSNEDLKQKIITSFPSQLRAVTIDDYIIRSYSLPPKYGSISKVYIEKNDKNILDLFILSKNNNLTICNDDIKNNLKYYLDNYKMINDSINIKDAFIINIGVLFDIVIKPNYLNKVVINNCIQTIVNYFNIDKWNINEPIILSELYNVLDNTDGVQTVKDIKIINKYGEDEGYSKYEYDINSATINRVIYPSLDPSIFELKYINDIQGRSVPF